MTKVDKLEKILIKDAVYTIQNNSYCFLPGDRMPKWTAGMGLLGKIQNWLKSYGKIYYSLLKVFGPVMLSLKFRRTIRDCLRKYTENQIIVNLGSGPQYFYDRTDIINVDLFAFDQVDVVVDACDLPFEDQSVDLIINMALLEHVGNASDVVQEMYRVLKPEGEVLAYVPFIVPYHAAPNDYYRWTYQGTKELFSSFDTINICIGCGPTSGMLYVLQEWLATLLSFGNEILHDIWFILLIILLFPIKFLDIFVERYKSALNVASGFGLIARKSMNL